MPARPVTQKKTLKAAEQDRPDVARRRRRRRVWQRYLDPTTFVFLDETSASTNMISRYGGWPKNRRLIDMAPHGHCHVTTFIAGLRTSGIIARLFLMVP